jgi:hypothetical protein
MFTNNAPFYSSLACDVTAAMLVDVNKIFLISLFCYVNQHGRHVFVFTFSGEWLQPKNSVYVLNMWFYSLFIQGYRQRGAFIATQGPLQDTVDDFWRMLMEQNSNIVVMMSQLHEGEWVRE